MGQEASAQMTATGQMNLQQFHTPTATTSTANTASTTNGQRTAQSYSSPPTHQHNSTSGIHRLKSPSSINTSHNNERLNVTFDLTPVGDRDKSDGRVTPKADDSTLTPKSPRTPGQRTQRTPKSPYPNHTSSSANTLSIPLQWPNVTQSSSTLHRISEGESKEAPMEQIMDGDIEDEFHEMSDIDEYDEQISEDERMEELSELKTQELNEEEKNRRIEHKIDHLLTSMFRCRECMGKHNKSLPLPIYSSNSKQAKQMKKVLSQPGPMKYPRHELEYEHCCIGPALAEALPHNFPIDLIPITQSYLLSNVSRSWLTTPPDPSLGVIQCYILKTNTRFELYLEMRDQAEFTLAKQRLVARRNENEENDETTSMELNELEASIQQKEDDYKLRQKVRRAMFGRKMSIDERLKQNAVNSMLQNNAEQLLMNGEDVFLLAALRRRAWTGNHYIISMEKENIRSEGSSYLGKLKSNFGGTEFVLYDHGNKTPKTRFKTSQPPIRELACVLYDHFFEHTGSPIRIKVLLPNEHFARYEQKVGGSIIKQYKLECEKYGTEREKIANAAADRQPGQPPYVPPQEQEQDEGQQHENTATNTTNDESKTSPPTSNSSSPATSPSTSPCLSTRSLAKKCKKDVSNIPSVDSYENLRPVWHDGMNAYVLHFDNHRVREKSVKNFKLVRSDDDTQRTVLQFGRVLDRNLFVMDFAWPLTSLQAFAICLSSIDPKLAV